MGFFSRKAVPRKIRHAVHPVRTAKRAVTPAPVKRIQRAAHPLNNAARAVERDLTSPRSRTRGTPRSGRADDGYDERRALMTELAMLLRMVRDRTRIGPPS